MIPDSQSEGSNNADKLNAEITAMRTKGARPTGTIFFPDRVYGIGSTIVLPEVNGYKFEGCGLTYAVPFNQESSTGKLGPASILAATTSLDPMIQVGTRWTTLDDITLYGYWWDSGVSPPATRSAIGIQQIDGGSFPTGKLRGCNGPRKLDHLIVCSSALFGVELRRSFDGEEAAGFFGVFQGEGGVGGGQGGQDAVGIG
jgi:hypothetical protein